jgi:hypothetical protein
MIFLGGDSKVKQNDDFLLNKSVAQLVEILHIICRDRVLNSDITLSTFEICEF